MAQGISHPRRSHIWLTGAATIGLWWLLSGRWTWATWIGCWLVAINVIAFGH